MSSIGLCVFSGQQPLWAHPAGRGLIIRPPIHHDHFTNPPHWLLKRFAMRFWRYSGITAARYFYIDTIYLCPLFILRRRIDCLSNPGISMETGRRNASSMIKAKCMAVKSGITFSDKPRKDETTAMSLHEGESISFNANNFGPSHNICGCWISTFYKYAKRVSSQSINVKSNQGNIA